MLRGIGTLAHLALAGGSRCRQPCSLDARHFLSANSRRHVCIANLRKLGRTGTSLERIDTNQRNALRNSTEKSKEHDLKLGLVKDMPLPLAKYYPFLYANEWDSPCLIYRGKGDLVFAGPDGRFAVVETKYIDLESSGVTASRRRTAHRKKVWDQAMNYMVALPQLLHREGLECKGVAGFTFTNEDRLRSCHSHPHGHIARLVSAAFQCRSCDNWFPEYVPDPTRERGKLRCAVCCEVLHHTPPAE